MIEIQLERDTVRLGETVTGKIIWSFPPAKFKEGIAKLVWYTEGRGGQDYEYVQQMRFDIDPDAGQPQIFPFAFPIPGLAPISYDGKLLRVLWRVEVFPMAMITMQSTQQPIKVLPR